ncbi:MAG TPA: [FeFe] hydrogenase H-cluster maturation GTPase HydF [bacterium]|nr:[FeFe] hydrogenase H-cluster maturation GTPase HydF [bacterium]HPS31645.1 [FeFe] hydrogenase H-cluster maturation GTPase HydF [bacterium]
MNSRTIRGDRLHIAFFGRRNAGKSSLINALTNQAVSIVSETPGTTTDPVFKSMELMPIGPVVLIDTAGMDDLEDALGEERVKRSEKVLSKTDLAIIVVDSAGTAGDMEDDLIRQCTENKSSVIIVLNKIDKGLSESVHNWITEKSFVRVSAKENTGIAELKSRIIEVAPSEWEPPFLRDLIHPGETVVLVTPIDLGAPKGRLIMPQVKAIRDILDGDAVAVMCKERELLTTLNSLKNNPALVVTDSQVFSQVSADVPESVPLTSFSILSIRQKGDLAEMVKSVLAVENLKPGDKVLVAESCSHHPLEDDIGRVKIPRWLNAHVGGGLKIETVPGCEYPDNLEEYKLVIHCGACTLNRKEMLRRQSIPAKAQIPMTNYGVLISYLHGVFPRALKPFPEIHRLFDKNNLKKDISSRKKMSGMAEI